MKNLIMYCVTNKEIKFINNTQYRVGWVGKGLLPNNYIACNLQDNIFFKEQYYSELTFQYWYSKNQLNLNNSDWVGFCQKRRFWIKRESINKKINDHIYQNKKINNSISSRTIGISQNNLEFYEKEIQKLPTKIKWEIKKIEIYSGKLKKNKILNFENNLVIIQSSYLLFNGAKSPI